MVYSLTWMPEVLERAGLKVAEVPDWRTRGRAEMGRVRGIICHHTAGAAARHGVIPSLHTLINGRPASKDCKALAGPLAQLGLARDGTWFVIAAGRANHAGEGAWKGITGNSSFIGIEAENSGKNDPWPDVQLDSYRRGVAALLDHLKLPLEMCCGHKEYAPGRKPDPSFDMNDFRAEVGRVLDGTASLRPPIPAADINRRPTLRRGARGELVKQLQAKLGLTQADGIFGPRTEAALREFQRRRNLVPDGILGPKSWRMLDTAQ